MKKSALAAAVASTVALAVASLAAVSQTANASETAVCAWQKPQPGALLVSPLAPSAPVLPANVLQQMLAQLPDCQKDAQFLAALGQLLNSQARYVEASDHLERALLLEPDLKDAQLSYAIALAGSGDVNSARAMLDSLLSDPGLPAALRPLIASQKALLTNNGTAESPAFQARVTLATRLGFDSNLLGSPNLSSLALTLPGQTIVLPLDDNYLARPARYGRTELQLELNRTTPGGARWDAVASLRSRYSPAVQAAGYSQIDLSIERSNFTASQASIPAIRPALNLLSNSAEAAIDQAANLQQDTTSAAARTGGSYFNASASALGSQSGTRFLAWGLGAGWGNAWQTAALAACQARTGLELQDRNYLDNKVLSGTYTGLSFNWSCEGISGAQLTLGLKAGTDHPGNDSRPGGVQRQASLKAAAYLPQSLFQFTASAPDLVDALTAKSFVRNGFLIDLELSKQQDSSGYSPIIDSGRSRVVSRAAARVEYQYYFSRSLQAFFGVEWVTQASNIALFSSTSRGAYAGLRRSW